MQGSDTNQLRDQYDECISKVNNITNLIKQLSSEHELENLEEVVEEQDFLNLLANSLYTVNSLTYAYCNIKGIEFPSEFAKVKEYYNKAKNPLVENTQTVQSTAPVVVNKQAAKRVIERSIK